MERPHRLHRSRAGFTLIELLVAILIIGTLIAILVPTIAAAFRTAKEAAVLAEMNNLATALASFKNTYGDYPPSRVILSEIGYSTLLTNTSKVDAGPPSPDATTADITIGQLAQRSLSYMRRFWPRADFMGIPSSTVTQGNFNDFNGNQKLDTYYIINGSECLTFFLGGIPIHNSATGNVTGLSGFSRSPTHPFVDSGISLATGNPVAPNRTVPNFEFNNGRLHDQDGDGIPSYFDALDQSPGSQRTYAYFSAYGTNQYDPNDVNGYGHVNVGSAGVLENFELEDDGSTPVERGFSVFFPTTYSTSAPYYAQSAAPNPYTTGPSAFAASSTATTGAVSWYNPNSFQILCSGADRLWGLGGQYVQNSTAGSSLPISASDPGLIHPGDVTSIRQREIDNLSNFSGGRLK